MTTFYKNYIALCAQKKKSASAVAVEIGLSRTSPNGWKKGKQPSDINLEKLANYFGVSVNNLLLEQKEKPPAETGEGLSKESIRFLLDKMSAAELVELMAECADEMRKRGSK